MARLADDPDAEVVYTKFCAQYMVPLVDMCLNPAPTWDPALIEEFEYCNAHKGMLTELVHKDCFSGRYVARFMRSQASSEKGRELVASLTERLLQQASKLDSELKHSSRPTKFVADPQKCHEYYAGEKVIRNNCQLVFDLLSLYVDDPEGLPVAEDVNVNLVPFLERWNEFLGSILCHRLPHDSAGLSLVACTNTMRG